MILTHVFYLRAQSQKKVYFRIIAKRPTYNARKHRRICMQGELDELCSPRMVLGLQTYLVFLFLKGFSKERESRETLNIVVFLEEY